MRETGGVVPFECMTFAMSLRRDETGISTFNWEVKSRKTVFLEIPRSTDESASIECRGTLSLNRTSLIRIAVCPSRQSLQMRFTGGIDFREQQ